MATTHFKFSIIFIIGILSIPSNCSIIKRTLIDGTTTSPDNTGDVKCSSCPPCGTDNPCSQSPPPPPPPPKKQKPPPPPSSSNCPPPPALPSPGYIYVPGPPGNLYPVDAFYSSAAGRNIPTCLVTFGLMVLRGFLW